MAKRGEPLAVLKVLVTGGQANPAPPLGPVLSQNRVDIGRFIGQFNDRTKDRMGVPLPVVIRVYRDRSFEFDVKTPPASYLIKRAAGLAKGSGATKREVVGSITRQQLREIAQEKMGDLNTTDIETAMRIVEGTARSCGVEIAKGEAPKAASSAT
jgi:large subunit ribosomal protein L11